ncbi:MAG TPA: polyphosphate kinase 1 [Acidimicrobiales bacterium]|nr:polyphosphate kinase 1 [Acidimicrobiales bacterium]
MSQAPPASPPLAAPVPESSERPLLDRELSRLDFDTRVLAQAEDTSLPLLERVKFLAIFAANLDDFFQVRVAGLKSRLAAGLGPGPGTGTPSQQLRAIRARAERLVERQTHVFLKELVPGLAERGIRLASWSDLDDGARAHLNTLFDREIFPVLTPLAVDPGHPFPYVSNLSLNLAVMVVDPVGGERRFARVKVPPLLPRFVVLPDGEQFVPLEQVIAVHLDSLFPGFEIGEAFSFRVSRNIDLSPNDEDAEDLLAAVEMELRRRRFGEAVRLEVSSDMSDEVTEMLAREIGVEDQDIYRVEGPLDLAGLMVLRSLDRADLKDEPWPPVTPPSFERADGEPADVFALVRAGDVLVHHPYDAFATTVQEFIRQASADPRVMAIKLALYRTSGDSPVIKSLIRAAERGKQVAVLVELQARGDEEANIAWARALEEAGVHVVYGLVGLKTHSKICLVVRQEDDGIRRYCHIGTGNYNPETARLYEDIGLLTQDPDIGADLTDLFNFLTGYSRQIDFRRILVSPLGLRERLIELISAEAARGPDGRVVMKVNNLVDADVISALYDASRAGTPVDLVVRSMCSLVPGVPGVSENIRVRSVVGRYLEHSRIWRFGADGSDEVRYYIGSPDMMERNLDRRVEVIAPVESGPLQERLQQVLDILLDPAVAAWSLEPDGSWCRVGSPGNPPQARLWEAAVARAARGDLEVAGEGG